ncbi:hypothetical protein ACYEVR_001148 [Yersinia enterocolitica]|nr:hypothetical protein [Yersinia enterocolitica]
MALRIRYESFSLDGRHGSSVPCGLISMQAVGENRGEGVMSTNG